MIGLHEVCRMHVARVDPLVVTLWESFPLDEIL